MYEATAAPIITLLHHYPLRIEAALKRAPIALTDYPRQH